jgi:hypothetical protein
MGKRKAPVATAVSPQLTPISEAASRVVQLGRHITIPACCISGNVLAHNPASQPGQAAIGLGCRSPGLSRGCGWPVNVLVAPGQPDCAGYIDRLAAPGPGTVTTGPVAPGAVPSPSIPLAPQLEITRDASPNLLTGLGRLRVAASAQRRFLLGAVPVP